MSHIVEILGRRIGLRGSPDQKGWISARCPFHDDRRPSFGVNVISGIANCYRCGSMSMKTLLDRLNVPSYEQDLALSDLPVDSVHASDMLLSSWMEAKRDPIFLPEGALNRMVPARAMFDGIPDTFSDDTLRYFGVVYDPMYNMTCWPIRDPYGRLVAISGRRSGEDAERLGKYKVYKRELEGVCPVGYTPDKGDALFNFHNVLPELIIGKKIDLVVVEGFKAAAWVHQCGFPHVVGIMSASVSAMQYLILLRYLFDSITLLLDNNKAGEIGTFGFYKKLSPWFRILVGSYPDERQQPDDLTENEVIDVLQEPLTFMEWSEMRGNIRIPRAPRTGGLTQDRLRISDQFSFKELTESGKKRTRLRLVKGNYSKELYNYGEGTVYRQDNMPYYFHRIHWPPFKAHPDMLPYDSVKWGGPLECTAGADEANPNPCIGCYMNDQWFVRADGKDSRAATKEEMALVTAVELDFFHTVEKVSDRGTKYTELVRCQKDAMTGRGRCPHCTPDSPRIWGRRLYWDMREWELNALLDFEEKEMGLTGVCGCNIFPVSYHCSNCGSKLQDVAEAGLSDEQAREWGSHPRVCGSCGHMDLPVEEFDCTRMNAQGPVTGCNKATPCSIWDTDIWVSQEQVKDRTALKFQIAGNTGIIPFAPPDVDHWDDRFNVLNVPYDFPTLVDNNKKDIQKQIEIVKPHSHPFGAQVENVQASRTQPPPERPATEETRPARQSPGSRTRLTPSYDGMQDDNDDDIPF